MYLHKTKIFVHSYILIFRSFNLKDRPELLAICFKKNSKILNVVSGNKFSTESNRVFMGCNKIMDRTEVL